MASAAGQSPPPRVPFVVVARTLDIVVDYAGGSLAGFERLTLRNAASQPATEVPLVLNRLMRATEITDAAGNVLPMRQDVVVFEDDSVLQVNAIVVGLAHPVAPGDSVDVTVRYGGHLVGYVETGSLYIQDKVDTAFTIIRQDAFAYPALGVPSRRVNRAMGFDHPFAFTARVTVPTGFIVATAGVASEPVRRDSLTTWTYRTVVPSPVLNIAVARYRTLVRSGLHIFYFPQDSAGARMVDVAVARAMARYASWYGTLESTLPVTIIEIPENWGSQASLAGGIMETADAFRDQRQLYQLYHELSHLWNPPDPPSSPRWNEGLAMFLQWRLAGELDGWAGWDGRIDRVESAVQRECQALPSCATVPFADYGKAEMTDLSYSVGLAMFYALYETLGAETFDRAYRDFLRRHRTGGATNAALVAAFHAASPASDAIFADWFTTTRWYARLRSGESVRTIVNGYPRP